MPGEKAPPRKPRTTSGPAWQIILEEMRSQNRATIEAVQSTRDELKRDIAELRADTNARFQVLEAAVRQNSADIRQNSADIRQNSADILQNSADIRQNTADILQNSADIRQNSEAIRQNSADILQNSADIRTLQREVRILAGKVDDLSHLETRVSALEGQRG